MSIEEIVRNVLSQAGINVPSDIAGMQIVEEDESWEKENQD